MWELQKRRKIQALLYSKVSLFMLLLVMVFLGRATFNVYGKYSDSTRAMNTAKQEAAALEAREKSIESENRRLMTESGIEKELRHKYSVKKEGEKLFIITDNPKETEEGKKTDASWWSRVETFFGKKSE